jgi:hypothetical protein
MTFNGLSEGEAWLHRVQERCVPCPKAGREGLRETIEKPKSATDNTQHQSDCVQYLSIHSVRSGLTIELSHSRWQRAPACNRSAVTLNDARTESHSGCWLQ